VIRDNEQCGTQEARNRVQPEVVIGAILMFIGSVTFSGKGIIVKLGYGYGVDAVTLLALRMIFALPMFLLMAAISSKGREALSFADWLGVLAMGFTGFYLASALDFVGLQYITASLERLVLCLQPTIVLFLGWFFLKRKISKGQIIGTAVSYAGILIVFGAEAAASAKDSAAVGVLFVFSSAISYSVYLLLSGEIVKRVGPMRLVGLATSFACVISLVHYSLVWPLENLFTVPKQVIWLSVLNATVSTAVPVLTVMMAIQRIGPALVSQISMMGPLFTILLGVWILDEPFSASVSWGAAFVVGGILLFTHSSTQK